MTNDNDYLKLEWHINMMVAARAHWPEMPESPNIVGASPGVSAVRVPVYDPPAFVGEQIPLGTMATFGEELIELEQVGLYRLGYGPMTQTLYVGSEMHDPVRLPVDWEGDSPFGDGDLKEPPVGVLYLDTE